VSRRPAWPRAAAALAIAAPVRAAPAEDRVAEPDWALHVPATLGVGLVYFLADVPFDGPLSRDACRWCAPIAMDGAVRDALVWEHTGRARTASDVTGYLAAPLVAVGGVGLVAELDGRGANWLADGFIVAQSALIASVVNFGIKAASARERPFVHQLAPGEKARTEDPQDNNQSFASGHATLSMSLAVSAGTVAAMRGYAWAPALYGGGAALSVATGWLRVAADRHWSTDVLAGWILGAAVGYAVPSLVHRKGTPIAALVSPSRIGIAVRW